MKTSTKVYSAASSAVRAAAAAFGVKRNKAEVAKVAYIIPVSGGWTWEARETEVEAKEIEVKKPTKKVEKKVTKKPAKKSGSAKTWNRPKDGTATGDVWALADTCDNRKEVMEKAGKAGLNLGMVAQQYYRWTHRSA